MARELTKEEKEKILKVAHSIHSGQMKTLEGAKKIGLWLGMDQEVKAYVKKCSICQLQRLQESKVEQILYFQIYL